MRPSLPTWAWVLGSAALGILIGYALSRALARTPKKRLSANKRETRRPTKRKAIEAIWESDDAVRRDIPPDLVPVFNKVKSRIKGKRTRDRTEAFLEWVEENQDAVIAMQAQAADVDVERLIREREAADAAAQSAHDAAVEAAEREAIEAAAAEDAELAELAARYADEPEPPEEPPEAEAEAAWREYASWEQSRPPSHADEDISDAEFFRRLEVVEGSPTSAAKRSKPRRKAASRPKGRSRRKAAREAPSGPVRALLPARGESQSA